MMLGSTLIPLIVFSFAGELKPVTVEARPDPAAVNRPVPVSPVVQEFTGINSKLEAPLRLRIVNEHVWQQVWFQHHNIGVIRGRNPHPVPEVDFSKHMVVGVVEKSERFQHGIQVTRIEVGNTRKARTVTFDYAAKPEAESDGPRPENVFGFFVIPKYQPSLSIRRQSDDGWNEVARFHALPPEDSIDLSVIATTATGVSKLGTGLKGGPSPAATAPDKSPVKSARPGRGSHSPAGAINIGFAYDPYQGNYDGVVGSPGDVWNFVDVGTTAVDFMRHPNATGSTARLRISRHDGEWAVGGHSGIFQGYIYHNCQCVDLEATLLDLAPARYKAYVFAHGDAPNQNAKIEIVVGDRSIGQKATANDGTWDFRSKEFEEGVQFVSFEFDVPPGETVRIISHRDGSEYSMFNAIQLVPIATERPNEGESDEDDLSQSRPERR